MNVVAPIEKELHPDAYWVQQTREGNSEAFDVLYRNHARRIAGLCYRLLADESGVEEIVQEAFLEAYLQLPKLKNPQAFAPWLSTIAVRKVQQRHSKKARFKAFWQQLSQEAPAAAISIPRPEAFLLLRKLSPELRVPWVLHKVEGFTLPETAERCHISLATTKRRIQKAQERLRRWNQ